RKEEAAIDDVTGTLSTHRGELSKVEQAAVKMESQIASAASTTKELGVMSAQTTTALSGLSGGTETLVSALAGMTGAAGLSVVALSGLTAGFATALAAGLLFGKFLVDSAEYYVEHGTAAKGLRMEMDKLSETWNAIKLIVGQTIVQPEESGLI